jgi:hypothetical protein
MTTMSPGRLRRKLRRAADVRRWSLRQKIGVGAWIPVLIVAFALFTGPSRSSSAASAPTTTSTTIDVVVPVLEPIVPASLSAAPKISMHDRVVKFVNGVPPKRSPAEKLALLKYNRAHSRYRAGSQLVIRRRAARAH